jgi:hypothetical protein
MRAPLGKQIGALEVPHGMSGTNKPIRHARPKCFSTRVSVAGTLNPSEDMQSSACTVSDDQTQLRKQDFSLPFNFLLTAFATDSVLPANYVLCFDLPPASVAFKETLQLRNVSKRYIDISTGYGLWVVVRSLMAQSNLNPPDVQIFHCLSVLHISC